MSTFVLPDLGEGLVEAEIVSWHVVDGDHVVTDQPLLSVETEKAVVEIPSPQAGHIGKLLAKVGDHVKVGMPLLEFEEGVHAETGTVMGQLEGMPSTPVSRTSVKKAASPPVTPASDTRKVRASPAIRLRARELSMDLSRITPTGPNNTITLRDVEAAAKVSARQKPEPLRGVRRTMASNMARAWREVVHATIQDNADIEDWSVNEDITCRVIRALIAGLRTEPTLNASFDAATLSLAANATIDLGIAIDSSEGLFVPVLRDVVHRSPLEWRQQIDMFKRHVQDRSLTPADLRGPTISLSNFGSISGRHASLIIIPPQIAILGVGRILVQPVAMSSGIALRRALPLSLTFDHRTITGGTAAQFLRSVIADLEVAG